MNLGIRSAAAFALIVQGDELLGVLGALARRHIDEEEFAHLGILAQQAAISIKSAQIFEENRQLRDRLLVENAYLQEEIRSEIGFSEIVGESRALRALLNEIRQVAVTDSTVLLLGETGTGKELIARAVHQLSPRRDRPLIKVNCGAIGPGLVESELFGHERGPLPPRCNGGWVASSWRTTAPCFWTRSGNCRRRARPGCCGCCRSRNSNGWAAVSRSVSTCASSRRPTGIWRRRSKPVGSGRISSTASMSSRHGSRRFGSGRTTSPTR